MLHTSQALPCCSFKHHHVFVCMRYICSFHTSQVVVLLLLMTRTHGRVGPAWLCLMWRVWPLCTWDTNPTPGLTRYVRRTHTHTHTHTHIHTHAEIRTQTRISACACVSARKTKAAWVQCACACVCLCVCACVSQVKAALVGTATMGRLNDTRLSNGTTANRLLYSRGFVDNATTSPGAAPPPPPPVTLSEGQPLQPGLNVSALPANSSGWLPVGNISSALPGNSTTGSPARMIPGNSMGR